MKAAAVTASALLDYHDLQAEEIDLDDVATSLAGMRRWRGLGVSVAQHSVVMAQHATSENVARWSLLHDAPEFLLADLPSPLKHYFPEYEPFREMEETLEQLVAERFGLDLPKPAEVKKLDKRAGRKEAEEYVPHAATVAYPRVRALETSFVPLWAPGKARRLFLAECRNLGIE